MKRKVPIQNIYYMLSYVWDDVNLFKHGQISVNDDFSSADMMADLFLYYSNRYIQSGILHEYVGQEEEIKGIKGKINFDQTINRLSLQNGKIVCDFDEYLSNNRINQIVKSIALMLYKSVGISNSRKVKLNLIVHQFSSVDLIDVTQNCFNISYNKQNLYSKSLINVCQFILKHKVFSTKDNTFDFLEVYDNENEFALLFEKFVYKFLKLKLLKNVQYQKNLVWNITGTDLHWLPKMKIDILFENDNEVFIIDTKYTKHFYSTQVFDNSISERLITGHLYQINAYLTNFQTEKNKIGLLIYPKPFEKMMVDLNYQFKDNSPSSNTHLRVKTIDLEVDWKDIEKQLLSIFNQTTDKRNANDYANSRV